MAPGTSLTYTITVSSDQTAPWSGAVFVDGGNLGVIPVTSSGGTTSTGSTATATWSGGGTTAIGTQTYTFTFANSTGCPAKSDTKAALVVLGLSQPSSTRNPSVHGAAVTFSTSLQGAGGTPYASLSSNVGFFNGSTLLGVAPLSSGTAVFTTTALPAGSDTIRAAMEAPNGGRVVSAPMVQFVAAGTTGSTGSTPTPTPAPTAAPTQTPTPSTAPAPAPVATTTPVSQGFTVGTVTPLPPGAASGPSVEALALHGAAVPLVGADPGATMGPGLLDMARIPAAEPLGGIGAIDYGDPLVVWPFLAVIIGISAAGIVVARRRWIRDDAEAAAEPVAVP